MLFSLICLCYYSCCWYSRSTEFFVNALNQIFTRWTWCWQKVRWTCFFPRRLFRRRWPNGNLMESRPRRLERWQWARMKQVLIENTRMIRLSNRIEVGNETFFDASTRHLLYRIDHASAIQYFHTWVRSATLENRLNHKHKQCRCRASPYATDGHICWL